MYALCKPLNPPYALTVRPDLPALARQPAHQHPGTSQARQCVKRGQGSKAGSTADGRVEQKVYICGLTSQGRGLLTKPIYSDQFDRNCHHPHVSQVSTSTCTCTGSVRLMSTHARCRVCSADHHCAHAELRGCKRQGSLILRGISACTPCYSETHLITLCVPICFRQCHNNH